MKTLTKTLLPSFTYQIQFQSGELERAFRSKDEIRSFLVAMFAGRDDKGNLAWDAYCGLIRDRVETLTPSRLLTERVRSNYMASKSTD
jgi:hypothetical protein